MPEKLKRILQNKNWRSWKKSDWLLLALAGILLLVIALPVESGDGTAEKAYNTAQGERRRQAAAEERRQEIVEGRRQAVRHRRRESRNMSNIWRRSSRIF